MEFMVGRLNAERAPRLRKTPFAHCEHDMSTAPKDSSKVCRYIAFMRAFITIVIGALLLGPSGTSGQNYPDRPIRIVTSAAGGSSDLVSRIIAQGLSRNMGQPIAVDNRGGSPVVPAQVIIKARPDGYTLLLYAANLWLLPFLQDNVPYDPVADFSPISLTTRSPAILVVNPSMPVRTVKELIALATARPKELNCASGAMGSTTHLSAELFKAMARIDVVRVGYRGSAEAVTAVIGGQVHFMFPIAAEVAPHLKSGRLRALAVASAQPSSLTPGLITMAAAGLPGYESGTVHGLLAPAKTPEAIVSRLHEATVQFINHPETKEKLFNLGLEVVANSPDEFAATISAEMARMGKVIKDAGIRAQ